MLHVDPVPSGDSPYGDAYLVSAGVDSAAFCSLEVSHSHLGHDPSALSEVDSEMKQAAEWEENWGFLKGMGSAHPPPPKADAAPYAAARLIGTRGGAHM